MVNVKWTLARGSKGFRFCPRLWKNTSEALVERLRFFRRAKKLIARQTDAA